ncbi:MAG: DinB family protein [Acidobacteria bacterium]|nr:DinB family protein [Acidobacteriota bacterium]MCA1609409.1 DinB family protein [Acidobacteriota bacterium]
MTPPADLLRESVSASVPLLRAIGEKASAEPRAPGKWSPREVIGHLVDSAANNHVRFVRGQLEEDLVFPGYEQEGFVRIQAYACAPWRDLVALWRAYNLHLARVIDEIPGEVMRRKRKRHNFHRLGWREFSESEPASLEDLIIDYVLHLRHHLGQVVRLPEDQPDRQPTPPR